MPSFFGFTPSETLSQDIDRILEKRHSSEALYPLRDQIALKLNEEIIDNVLLELVKAFPASDKKDTAEKLGNFVKSTVGVMLRQLLGKSSNESIQKSIEFIQHSLFTTAEGQRKVGVALPDHLVTNLKANFQLVRDGQHSQARPVLTQLYKDFAHEGIRHFMTDFNKTLELGMVKRKVAEVAASAVGKALVIGIDKLIPNLNKEELTVLAQSHDQLFFQ